MYPEYDTDLLPTVLWTIVDGYARQTDREALFVAECRLAGDVIHGREENRIYELVKGGNFPSNHLRLSHIPKFAEMIREMWLSRDVVYVVAYDSTRAAAERTYRDFGRLSIFTPLIVHVDPGLSVARITDGVGDDQYPDSFVIWDECDTMGGMMRMRPPVAARVRRGEKRKHREVDVRVSTDACTSCSLSLVARPKTEQWPR